MKKIAFSIVCIFVSFCYNVNAQTDSVVVPDWYINIPVEKGRVFEVAIGESRDEVMAIKKARNVALEKLSKAYKMRFDGFVAVCDSLLGANNEAGPIITAQIKSQLEYLSGVEDAKEKVFHVNGNYTCYILLQKSIVEDVKSIQKEIDANKDLKKQMKEKGLLKQLSKL